MISMSPLLASLVIDWFVISVSPLVASIIIDWFMISVSPLVASIGIDWFVISVSPFVASIGIDWFVIFVSPLVACIRLLDDLWMSTPVFVDPESSTQADEAQSSRVQVPLSEDPYEAIRHAYLVGTDTESEPIEDLGTELPEWVRLPSVCEIIGSESAPAGRFFRCVKTKVPKGMSRSVPKGMSRSVPKRMSRSVPKGMSRSIPEGMSRSVPERMSRSVTTNRE
ncbi:hypothetical protein Tco_0321564 [Tanacetum coccineum]